MAVGIQLQQLVTDLRAETSSSMNVAHGISDRDRLVYMIQRTENELYVAYDWRKKMIEREVALLEGVRYYDFPTDLSYDSINGAWTNASSVWQAVEFGIFPQHMNRYNSDDDERSWPARAWDINGDTGQLEVWPIPSQDGTLRVRGQKNLTPMVADTDTCTIDGTLIVLFAAVEILTRIDSTEAQLKLQKANSHLQRMRSQQLSQKSFETSMVPNSSRRSRYGYGGPRPFMDYIPS